MEETIHWSDWGQQPEIRIACTQSYERPWEIRKDLPEGVHEVPHKGEPSTIYTFNSRKVTCEVCKARTNYKESHKISTDYDRRVKESGLSEEEFGKREQERFIKKFRDRT